MHSDSSEAHRVPWRLREALGGRRVIHLHQRLVRHLKDRGLASRHQLAQEAPRARPQREAAVVAVDQLLTRAIRVAGERSKP